MLKSDSRSDLMLGWVNERRSLGQFIQENELAP